MGVVVFFVAIKLTRVLDENDRHRLIQLGDRLPMAFRSPFARIVAVLGPELRREAA